MTSDVIATGLSQCRTVGNRVAEGHRNYAEWGKSYFLLIQIGNDGYCLPITAVIVGSTRETWVSICYVWRQSQWEQRWPRSCRKDSGEFEAVVLLDSFTRSFSNGLICCLIGTLLSPEGRAESSPPSRSLHSSEGHRDDTSNEPRHSLNNNFGCANVSQGCICTSLFGPRSHHLDSS